MRLFLQSRAFQSTWLAGREGGREKDVACAGGPAPKARQSSTAVGETWRQKKKKKGGGAVKPKFKGSAFTFPVPRCRERPKVAAATRTDGTEVPVL